MGYSCNNDLIRPIFFDINYTSQPLNPNHCGDQVDERKSTEAGGSRWNPTPEQITALEELYRGGTRTPTTQQIQEIASKLREFGRIEGKNVFYWFQNHKARERLKRRRGEGDVIVTEKKDSSVLRRTGGHRVEQTKSCPSSSPTDEDLVLVPAKDKQNSDDNGRTEDSERSLGGGKDATWRSPKMPSDSSQYNSDVEERREPRTLDLFPVKENREKTSDGERGEGGYTGTRKVPNRLSCNCYCYYEFMPLKN